jgi:uncharacterized membrane protein YgcG
MSNLIDIVTNSTETLIKEAGVTNKLEFQDEKGNSIPEGVPYHIHITTDKKYFYMTSGKHESSSIIIFRVSGEVSNFVKYRNLKSTKRQEYITENRTTPTELDYKLGTFTLYFAKKVNDKTSKVFQINREDYKRHTPMYSKVPLTLFIYGERNDVEKKNFRRINVANSRLKGVESVVTPLEFFRPVKDKKEDVEERIKNRITGKTTQPEMTSGGGSTSGGSTSGGSSSGGGY